MKTTMNSSRSAPAPVATGGGRATLGFGRSGRAARSNRGATSILQGWFARQSIIKRSAVANNDLVIPLLLAVFFLTLQVLSAAAPVRPGGAEKGTGTVHSSALYTPPEPTATGGIAGKIGGTAGKILGVFAVPQDDWRKVYLATLKDAGEFRFSGLPAAKYDLVVLAEKAFYEGLTLRRANRADTLTAADRQQIAQRLGKSSAFFEIKQSHRCEGRTGADGESRVLLQEVRARPVTLQSAEVRHDIQIRSLKLALLVNAGPDWDLTETWELFRQEVAATDARGVLPAVSCPKLCGLRVIDEVRQTGSITVSATGEKQHEQPSAANP